MRRSRKLGQWKDYDGPRDAMGFIRLADVANQSLASIKKGKN